MFIFVLHVVFELTVKFIISRDQMVETITTNHSVRIIIAVFDQRYLFVSKFLGNYL